MFRRKSAAVVAVTLLMAFAGNGAHGQAPAAETQTNQALIRDELRKRGIVGYADHLGAQPGDTIRFMVSSELPTYRVDIVRMIMGDADSDGPGIKEEIVPAAVNNDHPGTRQEF